MNKVQFWKLLFGFSTVSVAIIYFLYIWHSSPVDLIAYISHIPLTTLYTSLLLSTLAGLINAVLWFKINQKIDHSITFSLAYRAWSVGRIYRYIPGKVAGYIMRNKLQKSSIKLGISASINEFISALIPIIFLITFFFFYYEKNNLLALTALVILLLLTFSKPIMGTLFSQLRYSTYPLKSLSSPLNITYNFTYILPAMVLHGASFYFILTAGHEEFSITFFEALIVFYISGVLGQLSLIAPGGIGVREASIVFLLLSLGVDEDITIASAIISRVVLLFSELFNALIASAMKRAYKLC